MFSIPVHPEVLLFSQKYFEDNQNLVRSKYNLGLKYQIAGLVGEGMLKREFGVKWKTEGDHRDSGCDFILMGQRFDVKTQLRALPAQKHFLCTVDERQMKNNNDAYLFSGVSRDFKTVEFVGWIPKAQFLMVSTIFRRGDTLLNGAGIQHIFKADCRGIKVSRLREIRSLSDFVAQVDVWRAERLY